MRIAAIFQTLALIIFLSGCTNTVVPEQDEQFQQNTELKTQYYYAPKHAMIPGIAPHQTM